MRGKTCLRQLHKEEFQILLRLLNWTGRYELGKYKHYVHKFAGKPKRKDPYVRAKG
jgi:hypothetical protein